MVTPIQSEDRRLRYSEAAAMLGIGEKALSLWIRAGRINRVLVSKRKAYILESEVRRVLAGMPAPAA